VAGGGHVQYINWHRGPQALRLGIV